jgi:hypothetical protein
VRRRPLPHTATDAETQTAVQADVAWGMGLIDGAQRKAAEAIQDEVIELVSRTCEVHVSQCVNMTARGVV